MKSSTIVLAVAIGAFLGVVVVCGGLGVALLAMLRGPLAGLENAGQVTDIAYDLVGPKQIALGEPATFTVQVTNTSDIVHRTLYSVDLYTDLVVQGPLEADPVAPSMHIEHDGEWAKLKYGMPLPPGATETITVRLNPTRPGEYWVNIDVCIDDSYGFIERFHDLTVTAGPEP